jgi:ribosomal protein S1
MWEEEVKQKWPVGSRVFATVVKHAPFGIFVDLGDSTVRGLVNIPEISDQSRITPEDYPSLGSVIEAMVLGHRVSNQQIVMTIKPSRLHELS